MQWIGKSGADDGHGRFEDGGQLIHFDHFRDYFYIQRLFDERRKADIQTGRHEVAEQVDRYVKGITK